MNLFMEQKQTQTSKKKKKQKNYGYQRGNVGERDQLGV